MANDSFGRRVMYNGVRCLFLVSLVPLSIALKYFKELVIVKVHYKLKVNINLRPDWMFAQAARSMHFFAPGRHPIGNRSTVRTDLSIKVKFICAIFYFWSNLPSTERRLHICIDH